MSFRPTDPFPESPREQRRWRQQQEDYMNRGWMRRRPVWRAYARPRWEQGRLSAGYVDHTTRMTGVEYEGRRRLEDSQQVNNWEGVVSRGLQERDLRNRRGQRGRPEPGDEPFSNPYVAAWLEGLRLGTADNPAQWNEARPEDGTGAARTRTEGIGEDNPEDRDAPNNQ